MLGGQGRGEKKGWVQRLASNHSSSFQREDGFYSFVGFNSMLSDSLFSPQLYHFLAMSEPRQLSLNTIGKNKHWQLH